MLRIYKPLSNLDWLNYRLVKKDLTFHHIVKRVDGGRETMDNGAILMPIPHQYLHIIEFKDWKTYKHINLIYNAVSSHICLYVTYHQPIYILTLFYLVTSITIYAHRNFSD